jgi:hypothetical protein
MDSASPPAEQLDSKRPNDVVSLAPLRNFFYVMRGWIGWGGIAIVFLGLVIVAAIYLGAPKVRYGELKISLTFPGAQNGLYPNNLPFSPEDILSADILKQVYDKYRVRDFIPFEEFRDSFSIRQNGTALQQLRDSFQNRLQDPKLLGTERQRLEEEFKLQRASMPSTEYTLIWLQPNRMIPAELQAKVLEDIPKIWSQETIENKKVLQFPVPLPNPSTPFDSEYASANPFGAYDLLDVRLNSLSAGLSVIGGLPGANQAVLPNGTGLIDLQIRLRSFREEDMSAFETRILFNQGSAEEAAMIQNALAYQISSREREVHHAERQVELLSKSFQDYLDGRGGSKTQRREKQETGQSSSDGEKKDGPIEDASTSEFSLLKHLEESTSLQQEQTYRKQFIDQITSARTELGVRQSQLEEARQNVFLVKKFTGPSAGGAMPGKARPSGEASKWPSTAFTSIPAMDINEFATMWSHLNENASLAVNLVEMISKNYFGESVVFYTVYRPFQAGVVLGPGLGTLVFAFVAWGIFGFTVLVGWSWIYYRHKILPKELRKMK